MDSPQTDIEYLRSLGVSVEDIARRAARSPEAIRGELREIQEQREREARHEALRNNNH